MPVLIFQQGDREVLRYPLQAVTPIRIGRHPSNDLTLPDEEVSRHHAGLAWRDGFFWIEDQSRNGTLLNGRRIEQAPLKNGDQISIGSWKVVFLEEAPWQDRNTLLQPTSRRKKPTSFHGLVGSSPPMRRLSEILTKVAPSDVTVLIMGETGTGKEIVARALHSLSGRSPRPFVAINCGAISPQLIESELFGHEKGAFTGAVSRHRGAFEQAQNGTLFLDEIGELPLELQPKLLRVLEERSFRRVGGQEEIAVDVRILAATHRELKQLCAAGRFREDLYFRLCTVPVVLAPLRERQGDLAELVRHFLDLLQGHPSHAGSPKKTIGAETLAALARHSWPGNIRELRNVLTRAILFAPGSAIRPEDVFLPGDEDRDPSLEGIEKNSILKALRESGWNKRKAADSLDIAKSTLFHKIRDYKIQEE